MKIGILTLPLHSNYGGILQAYALQTLLKKHGHDVFVLDNRSWLTGVPKRLMLKKRYLIYIKRFFVRCFIDKNIIVCLDLKQIKEFCYIRRNTNYFIGKYINYAPIKSVMDAIVVGSDQVWRQAYTGDRLNNYFLSFLNKTYPLKKIAFSASFGTDEWEYSKEETKKCASLIKQFDFISVREDSGVELCKKYLGADATLTLDPTLLIDKSDYIKLVEQVNEPSRDGSLFYYILDETPEKLDLINRVAKERNLKPFKTMPDKQQEKFEYKESYCYPTVTAWLRSFMDAEFVVTDSFHGCVFSIIFNKPFIAIGNRERGMSRFNSLLKLFQLEDRLVFADDGQFAYKNREIDWDKVNTIHSEWKKKSIVLLSNALSEKK